MANFSGAHLKSLRKEAGLTQKELASRIGLSRETVVAIENEYVGSIDKLSIEVVNSWWAVCRRTVSAKTKESFKSQILRFFNIQNS
ncbi:helix-turn-helix transcriptional regulator [Thalassomonas actiniarum]|uniref:Helix-turn-helix domain-containing protein n=1 Tax=Thalassomonas actiniarum TaxID=485447 RepID=A0AAE9YWT9_9GAMM|nr:helix-turn-helix domain-containing protein [Thalassomonas actiniarum]WDE01850.1 helix-turn-helix domain-containing protein [Thalassomonas actiniarum]